MGHVGDVCHVHAISKGPVVSQSSESSVSSRRFVGRFWDLLPTATGTAFTAAHPAQAAAKAVTLTLFFFKEDVLKSSSVKRKHYVDQWIGYFFHFFSLCFGNPGLETDFGSPLPLPNCQVCSVLSPMSVFGRAHVVRVPVHDHDVVV